MHSNHIAKGKFSRKPKKLEECIFPLQRHSERPLPTPLIHRIDFCFYSEGNNSQNLAYLGWEMVAAHHYLFPGSTSSTFLWP